MKVSPHRPAELPVDRNEGLRNNARAAADPNGLVTRFGGFRLQPHQINVCKLFSKPATPGLLLYFKVGSGKTLASIAAVENLARAEGRRRDVLVVGPASLKANYAKEVRAAGVVDAGRYRYVSFQGVHAIAQRIQRNARRADPEADPDVVRAATDAALRALGAGKVLVVDEVQNVKNPDGALLSSLLEVSRAAHKRLLLTGTPVVNYPSDIGAYLGLVDPARNERLTVKAPVVGEDGVEKDRPVFEREFGRLGQKNRPLLDSLMRCTTLFYEPGPEFRREHYPTKTEHWVDVPLTPQQTRRQFQIAAEIVARENHADVHESALEDSKSAKAFVAAARQVNNAWGIYHPKIDVIAARIIDDVARGGKCVFYDFFKDSWKTLDGLLRAHPAVRAAAFTGDTPAAQRAAIVGRYNSGDLNVLLLSSAGGEGLDLKNTTQMHVLQPWWNEEKINQVIGRAVRYRSHTAPRRHVDVFRYCSAFPPGKAAMVPRGIANPERELGRYFELTADQMLKEISVRKARANAVFLRRLVRISDDNLRDCA